MHKGPKSFFQFVKETKSPFVFGRVLNVVFIVLVLAIGLFWKRPVPMIGFLTVGFLGIKLLPYWYLYQAAKAVEEVSASGDVVNHKRLHDVGVYIKDFDVYDKVSLLGFNTAVPLYSFEIADIILTENAIILHGLSIMLGAKIQTPPVELVAESGHTSLHKARIIYWLKKGPRIEIKLHDPIYKNPIRIEFKDQVAELEAWLENKLIHLKQG